ncbi:GGDEF domain-containing protein [Sporichthya sp.]|uniref:GGDEF domain-containing protein n=1 Tax=Sporichthya sp. TaxID=65475 RepID=UPI0017AC1F60|nr:GGDEF domain-containing protein [Sporichthya sp.]MBA3741718.1 GGDEF domain-containing protein [Sporichthya sp.]
MTSAGQIDGGVEQALLRSVLDNVPAPIAYWDRARRNVVANRAYLDWFGRTPEQARGLHIREVLGEVLYRRSRPHIDGVLAGVAQQFDRTVVDPSGRVRHSQTSYVPDLDQDGAVRGFYSLVSDVTARVHAEADAATMRLDLTSKATTDPLTGLANRRELTRRGTAALAECAAGGGPLALLVLDLDGFKAVNDAWGHAAGDAVLVQIAGRLTASLRPTDLVARVGGDEFVVVIPHIGSAAAASRVADRLIAAVRTPVALGSCPSGPISLGVSVGVVVVGPGPGQASLDQLMAEADRRMYCAKREGGARWSG